MESMAEAACQYRGRGAALAGLLEERIAILDGAMATRIQTFGLGEMGYRGAQFRNHDRPLMGNYDLLSITQPDLIRSIHRDFLQAGADIITTNSFGANAINLGGSGLTDQVYAINLAAARIATSARRTMEQAAPEWPRFVAGAVSAPDAPAEVYTEQVRGLLDGSVDLLLLETVFDTGNAIAALDAFEECFQIWGRRIPVIVSASITHLGRLLSGETLEEFWNVMSARGLFGVGINCSVGPSLMEPCLEQLSNIATPFLVCYPNAGLPDPSGQYLESPDDMASVMEKFADKGWLNLAGGCCGTRPEHVRRMGERLRQKVPRRRPQAIL